MTRCRSPIFVCSYAGATMGKLIALELLLLGLLCTPAAAGCEQDTIRSVVDDGGVIVLLSGQIYQVDSVDKIDSALWLTAEDVLVCDDKMINIDEDGENVAIRRIR